VPRSLCFMSLVIISVSGVTCSDRPFGFNPSVVPLGQVLSFPSFPFWWRKRHGVGLFVWTDVTFSMCFRWRTCLVGLALGPIKGSNFVFSPGRAVGAPGFQVDGVIPKCVVFSGSIAPLSSFFFFSEKTSCLLSKIVFVESFSICFVWRVNLLPVG